MKRRAVLSAEAPDKGGKMRYPEQVKIFTEVLIGLSWLAVIFAIYCFVGGSDVSILSIAGSQWLLIAAVLGINAVFFNQSCK